MPITREQLTHYQGIIAAAFESAGIVITPEEKERLEVADFGLNDFEKEGLGVLEYVNTDRCCAKELALMPGQTCPEHRHPPVAGEPGKEETFRVRRGVCYLYVDTGTLSTEIKATPPSPHYRKLTEFVLTPGLQYTLKPNTFHWFQAGPQGCVVSEFSTKSRDECDVWQDPRIARIPVVEG